MKTKLGCLIAGSFLLVLPLALVAGLRWQAARPESILKNFLKVERNPNFSRVESEIKIRGPFEEDVHVYIEAPPSEIRSLLVEGEFELAFIELDYNREDKPSTAPFEFRDAPAAVDLVTSFYSRNRPGISESVGVSNDHSQMWYKASTY